VFPRHDELANVVGVLLAVVEEIAAVPIERGQTDPECPRRLAHGHQAHQDVLQELNLTRPFSCPVADLLVGGQPGILADMTRTDFGLVCQVLLRYSHGLLDLLGSRLSLSCPRSTSL
jgi:hypothetical protein